MKKKTAEQFIQEARKIHGDKYDYSKVVYKNSVTPVTIICREHGEFPQLPYNHLKGMGCRKCARENSSKLWRKTTEDFIQEARKIHGDKYDYSKVNYINYKTKVTIICPEPEHGKFEQTPYVHLQGAGCPSCARDNRINSIINKRLPYKIAYKLIQKFDIKSQKEYIKIYESKLKPLKFPKYPESVYKKEGWKGWAVFLSKSRNNKNFLSYNEAKSYINKLHIKSQKEWGKFRDSNNLPNNIPKYPESVYKNKGWKGWKDWFGEDYFPRYRKYISYNEAKSKLSNFNLKSYNDFIDLYRSNKIRDIPYAPNRYYKDDWEGWATFLGYNGINNKYIKHQKFNLIKEFINEYRLREFLMTNDINILHVIIQNLVEVHQIDSKYDPIIDEIINYTKESNPLKILEEKYNEEFDQTYNESINLNDIDLDDDEIINNIADTISSNQKEYSIDEIIKAKEGQLKLIESCKNIISPEVIKYIEDKYSNDKLREWISKRDEF